MLAFVHKSDMFIGHKQIEINFFYKGYEKLCLNERID